MTPLLVGIVIVITIFLFMALVVYLSRQRVKELKETRKKLFEQYAHNQSVNISEDDVFGLYEKISLLDGLSVIGNQLKNIVSVPTDQGSLYLFDQLKVPTSATGSQWGVFTVCFAESRSSLGADLIINEAENERAANIARNMGALIPGMDFLTFDDNMFDNRFVVTTKQEDNAKKLLNDDVRRFLLNNASVLPAPVSIQIKGNLFAVYTSALSSKSIHTESQLGVLVDIANVFLASKKLTYFSLDL